MRALLVNPWVYDFKAFDFWNKPLGLMIVVNILKKYGVEIDFIDCMDRLSPYYKTNTRTDAFGRGKYFFEEVEKPKIFKEIPRRYKRYGMPRQTFIEILNHLSRPDIIFVTSGMTYWYLGVFETIRILKEKFPKTKIVLGGLYATLCRAHAENYSGADIVLDGQAQERLPKLLQRLKFIEKIVEDDTEIPPDFSVYHKLNYGVILTSNGCPFNCSYCATNFLVPRFHALPVQTVISQLEYLSRHVKNIAFFDDALLCNPHLLRILNIIIEKEYGLLLHSSNGLHCRFINHHIASMMFRANFKTIYLSLETVNPEVQKSTGGKVKTEEFLNAVKILKEVGFKSNAIHVYLLYGMPGQSHEEILDAIKLCYQLGVHPHLCEFSPIPHTEEFKKTEFDENTDPLYHNNHFYTWYYPEPKPEIYKQIKKLLSLPGSL